MKVRCKMRLESITTYQNSREFKFHCVSDDGTPENQRFNKASPDGEFRLIVNNDSVQYEVGKCYYFDSQPCETTANLPSIS